MKVKQLKIVLFLSLLCTLFFKGEVNNTAQLIRDYTSIKYPSENLETLIYVGIKRQKLYLLKGENIILEFDVSTAKYGAGCQKGSEKTPVGLHEVRRKIGNNVPLGGAFDYQKFKGEIAEINQTKQPTKEDYILTRILTLRGLEDGINKGQDVDSYERAIYIHGTADEGLIGTPASHGCVRMRNEDIITLFNEIEEGVKVILFNN